MEKTIKKTITGMLILLILCISPRAAFATPEQARVTALALAIVLKGKYGYQMRDEYYQGALLKGESYIVTTGLAEGLDYAFAAGGCDSAYDVDIAVYDSEWNLITKDTNVDKSAWVSIVVYRSGTFHIKVTMYDCESTGADWALVCGFK